MLTDIAMAKGFGYKFLSLIHSGIIAMIAPAACGEGRSDGGPEPMNEGLR
ncbi:MAG TPA: hypothetical protein VFO39_16185 [Candidatus Sulfotelmatobacter sp.]|nr:hypothetical protein [Candidatus Sulfotelmatobacter sp.]